MREKADGAEEVGEYEGVGGEDAVLDAVEQDPTADEDVKGEVVHPARGHGVWVGEGLRNCGESRRAGENVEAACIAWQSVRSKWA